jgi:hypothetical protein
VGAGAISATVTDWVLTQPVYYRTVALNGASKVYGTEQTFNAIAHIDHFNGVRQVSVIVPILVLIAMLFSGSFLTVKGVMDLGNSPAQLIVGAIILAFSVIGFIGIDFIIQAINNWIR